MKELPLRKCLISQKQFPKSDLFRIVRTPNGEIVIDNSQKLNGRGAYLSKDKLVIEKAKKTNALSRALKCEIDPSIYDELIRQL